MPVRREAKRTGAAENKAVVRAYFRAYETGDIEAVMAFVHPGHRFHPEGGGRALGYRGRRREDAAFFRNFSAVRVAIEDQVAEGDRVATRVTMTAVPKGSPARRHVRIPFLDLARVRKGKIVEEWTEYDWEGLRRRLRAARSQGHRPGMDADRGTVRLI